MQTCIDGCGVQATRSASRQAPIPIALHLNKPVSLIGLGAGATFVALSDQRVLTVTDSAITQTTRIDKLTFTGGNLTSDIGGGIYIENGAPLLSNVVVTGNMASSGGGIYAGDSLHAIDLTVHNNSAIGFLGPGQGGGVFINSRAVISRMQVISNAATGDGAGIYLESGDGSTIESSHFTENKALGEGGGLYIATSNGDTVEQPLLR